MTEIPFTIHDLALNTCYIPQIRPYILKMGTTSSLSLNLSLHHAHVRMLSLNAIKLSWEGHQWEKGSSVDQTALAMLNLELNSQVQGL